MVDSKTRQSSFRRLHWTFQYSFPMTRFSFGFLFLAVFAPVFTSGASAAEAQDSSGRADREYSVAVLTRIAEPVLIALSKGELKKQMPVHDWERERVNFTR